jgi:fibrillarin-like pre-rRNA processing protein
VRDLGPKFPNIAEEKGMLFTKSTHTDFNEQLVERDGVSWRPWERKRSKLGSAIAKKISQIGIREGDTVLYLGASHGYTPTFVADIVGEKGVVFCLDFAPNVVRDLLKKCRNRTNMIPLLADAKRPETYSHRVSGADVVFQDIAQKDQVGIFKKNCELYLKSGGFGLLSLKARSVDVTMHPKDVFKETYKELERTMKVVDYRELDPFEKDHAFFVVKKL